MVTRSDMSEPVDFEVFDLDRFSGLQTRLRRILASGDDGAALLHRLLKLSLPLGELRRRAVLCFPDLEATGGRFGQQVWLRPLSARQLERHLVSARYFASRFRFLLRKGLSLAALLHHLDSAIRLLGAFGGVEAGLRRVRRLGRVGDYLADLGPL